MLVAPAARERPGYAGYQFGVSDEETDQQRAYAASKTCPRPTPRASRPSRSASAKPPSSTRPLEAQIIMRHGGSRRPRGRAQADAAGRARDGDDRRQAAVRRQERSREGDKAGFDVVFVAPDGKRLARDGLRYELLKIESRYQWYRQNGPGNTSRSNRPQRVADGDARRRRRQAVAHYRCRRSPAAIASTSNRPRPTAPLTSVQFDVGWYSDGSADTPDLLEIALDKPEYQSGDTMVVAVTARIGRQA